MPKVSIIIAVYNVEQQIRQCLDSIAAQTLQDIEIIAVDDGSTDRAGQICDEYSRSDPRFHVIHQDNAGVSSARNRGLQSACGEWITFVDADDWIEPDLCQVIYEETLKSTVDLVMWNHFWNTPGTQTNATMYPESVIQFSREQIDDLELLILDSSLVDKGMVSNATFAWCKLWRREILQANGGARFDEKLKWGEDQLFNLSLLETISGAVYIKRCLYHYRVSGGNVSKSYREDRLEMCNDYLRELLRFVSLHKAGNSAFMQAYNRRVVYTLILLNRVHFCHELNGQRWRVRSQQLKSLLNAEPYSSALAQVDLQGMTLGRKFFVRMAKRQWCLAIMASGIAKVAVSKGLNAIRRNTRPAV